MTCSGCFSLSADELDRFAAALVELRERNRWSREDIATIYGVPLALLPERSTSGQR